MKEDAPGHGVIGDEGDDLEPASEGTWQVRVPVFAFGLDEGGEGMGSGASADPGTTRARAFELGAKTPWYRTEWILGGGTRVASRARSSSGSRSRKREPPRGRFIR